MKKEKLQHKVYFERGHNCIDFECIYNLKKCEHGKAGLKIRFVVKGEKGAIQFLIGTSLYPARPEDFTLSMERVYIEPQDLGYHSLKPMYKGHKPITSHCEFLNGKSCYYDGSTLNAYDPFCVLANAGEEALWEYLEEYYYHIFYGEKHPELRHYPKPLRNEKIKTAKRYFLWNPNKKLSKRR